MKKDIKKKKEFKASLVKDVFFVDKQEVEQGKTFEKTWTFMNEGGLSWPADARLEHVSGAKFGELKKIIPEEVKAGE